MKKKSIFILAITLFSVFSYTGIQAQNFKLGIKGGVNLNIHKLNNIKGLKNSYGFNMGVYTKIRISAIALQAEFMYSTDAGVSEIMDGIGRDKYAYLRIPLLAGFQLSRLYIVAGPSFGFKLKEGYTFDTLLTRTLNTKVFDAGITAGLGIDISQRLSLSLRYSFGLTNLSKEEKYSLKNNTFKVQLEFAIFKI